MSTDERRKAMKRWCFILALILSQACSAGATREELLDRVRAMMTRWELIVDGVSYDVPRRKEFPVPLPPPFDCTVTLDDSNGSTTRPILCIGNQFSTSAGPSCSDDNFDGILFLIHDSHDPENYHSLMLFCLRPTTK